MRHQPLGGSFGWENENETSVSLKATLHGRKF